MPLAQLFKVPSTRVPVGSAAVRIMGWPAAGPPTAKGVSIVTRRAWREGRTMDQTPRFISTSITDSPCAIWLLRTFSAVQGVMPPTCSSPSSVYSWFMASRPRVELLSSG